MIGLEDVTTTDPVAQLLVSLAALIAFVIVGVISELTRRRTRKLDSTVGEPPAVGDDQSTVAEHVASTDSKLDLAIEQLGTMRDLIASNGALMSTRMDHVDAVLAERGRQLEELKASAREHGERLGDLERRVVVVETRLDSCPATATPTPGGSS